MHPAAVAVAAAVRTTATSVTVSSTFAAAIGPAAAAAAAVVLVVLVLVAVDLNTAAGVPGNRLHHLGGAERDASQGVVRHYGRAAHDQRTYAKR